MPSFSVVMPVYNKGSHIARAIRSVLDQTFDDFELILVNDASTDNSLEEIEKFADPRIRLFHREVPGPGGYAARNLGIREANAKWVAFLDADDEWFPDHLEAYRKLIEQFPLAEMLCCGYQIQIGSNCFINQYFIDSKELGDHTINTFSFLKKFAENSFLQWTSVACVKKSLLCSFGAFPAGKITKGGDLYTWFMCALKGKEIAWSAHLGAIYHADSENMVSRTTHPSAGAILELTEELLSSSPKENENLIKKIHNNTVVRSYKRRIVSAEKKFSIPKFLFFSANPLQFLIWSLFDFSFGQLSPDMLAKLACLFVSRPTILRFSKKCRTQGKQ